MHGGHILYPPPNTHRGKPIQGQKGNAMTYQPKRTTTTTEAERLFAAFRKTAAEAVEDAEAHFPPEAIPARWKRTAKGYTLVAPTDTAKAYACALTAVKILRRRMRGDGNARAAFERVNAVHADMRLFRLSVTAPALMAGYEAAAEAAAEELEAVAKVAAHNSRKAATFTERAALPTLNAYAERLRRYRGEALRKAAETQVAALTPHGEGADIMQEAFVAYVTAKADGGHLNRARLAAMRAVWAYLDTLRRPAVGTARARNNGLTPFENVEALKGTACGRVISALGIARQDQRAALLAVGAGGGQAAGAKVMQHSLKIAAAEANARTRAAVVRARRNAEAAADKSGVPLWAYLDDVLRQARAATNR